MADETTVDLEAPPEPSAIDRLVEQFMEQVTPNYHQSQGAASTTMDVAKADVRACVRAILVEALAGPDEHVGTLAGQVAALADENEQLKARAEAAEEALAAHAAGDDETKPTKPDHKPKAR